MERIPAASGLEQRTLSELFPGSATANTRSAWAHTADIPERSIVPQPAGTSAGTLTKEEKIAAAPRQRAQKTSGHQTLMLSLLWRKPPWTTQACRHNGTPSAEGDTNGTAQSHSSSASTIEEAHEVLDAVDRKVALLAKNGDLLIQSFPRADRQGNGDLTHRRHRIHFRKMLRRISCFSNSTADTPEAVSLQWDHIKKHLEKGNTDRRVEKFPSSSGRRNLQKPPARASTGRTPGRS